LKVYYVHPVSEGCKQSVLKRGRCAHILASPGKGGLWWTLTVDGGSDIPSLSPGIGEVNYYASLYLESGVAVVLFSQLGLNGHLLAGDFASLLQSPALSVDPPSAGSCLLHLLIGLLLLRKDPNVWL
jgi:hypothetical protein